MYWLLPPDEQEATRNRVVRVARELASLTNRVQNDQKFPFLGRKDRRTARAIVKNLTDQDGIVCDPFSGSGTFVYAALDEGRQIYANEWEPYAHRLSTAPFRRVPSSTRVTSGLRDIHSSIGPRMNFLYKTICLCGREHVLDSLFYDRDPEEYFSPMPHDRLGTNGENVIYRRQYKCTCGATEKHFDTTDWNHLQHLKSIPVSFPNVALIENSRINFTAPDFVHYGALFPNRSKHALRLLFDAIQAIADNDVRDVFFDAFLSILVVAKYCDYRSKSQDPHCPPNRLRETNLYHRFIEKVNERVKYLRDQTFVGARNPIQKTDFRRFFRTLSNASVDLMLTDPPYGDSAQYFESAQRFHPFMSYSLVTDTDRLENEVVISDAPTRPNKHDRTQFLNDIETLFEESSRVVKDHGYFVMYFRPQQSHWVADLNLLRMYGRKHGFEPLMTIDVAQNDPSMRVLASTAWTFARDCCFIFLKLGPGERRWFEGSEDIDELVYKAVRDAAGERGLPFTKQLFNQRLLTTFRAAGLIRLTSHSYEHKIESTLMRFCHRQGSQYILTGESPYEHLYFGIDAELRMREFIPVVVEELSSSGQSFTFEQFVLRLSTYLDNGNRKIIERLHLANRLIPDLLLQHAEESGDGRGFVARDAGAFVTPEGRTNVLSIDPTAFEQLIGEYLRRRGFIDVNVIGQAGDRGVDIIATDTNGELHLVQCKRYRPGNNIGSGPIQRVDSYRRSRHAAKSWVITTSDFTREGRDEARITEVSLINGEQLMQSLEIYFPEQFYIPS